MTRMKNIGCVLVFFIFLHCIRSAAGSYCEEWYSCQRTCYRTERTKILCWRFWTGFQCTTYCSKPYICDSMCYRQVCCEGWTGSHCSTPLCNGMTICNNGGTCTSPNTCRCQIGYAQPHCHDDNECDVVNGGCFHNCNNVPGSYTCSCRNGYTLDSDLKGCTDINECEFSNGWCQELCVNTDGSYRCDCPTGFTLNTDGKTCKDIRNENVVVIENENDDIRNENVVVIENENDGDTISTMDILCIMACAIVLVISFITIYIFCIRRCKSVQGNPQDDEISKIDIEKDIVSKVTLSNKINHM